MMNRNFLLTLTLLIWIMIACVSCNFFAAGSYPFAEDYELRIKESELITAIKYFKKNNPQYCVPAQLGLNDEWGDSWYYVYFYYRDDDEIIFTYVRHYYFEEGMTSFAFVSVNKGLQLGNWKDINRDFSNAENKLQKEKFENRIIKGIENEIRNRVK